MPRIVPFAAVLGLTAGLLSCSSGENQKKAKSSVPAPQGNPLTQRGGPFRQQWAMDTLWEDGLAEVATYDAEQVVAGTPHRFVSTLITVKEEFNQQYNVRTEMQERPDRFPVMTVNQLSSIPTPGYPVHFLTSLFFRRDQPVELHKLTTSAQEAWGTTFKSFTNDGLQYQQTYNSYHDGEGAGRRTLPPNALFEDALCYTLRSLRFTAAPAFSAPVYEWQQTSRATNPKRYQARIRVLDGLTADTEEPAWQVVVTLADRQQNVYWFAKAYPNVLLRQTTWDGRTLRLRQVRRAPHWPRPGAATPPDSVVMPVTAAAPDSGAAVLAPAGVR